jgi:uncharacterized membrane protein
MKRVLDFFKTTIAGGFFVILPIVLIVLVLGETIELLGALVDPIAQQLPIDSVGGIAVNRVLSILFILALCFLTGLVMRTRPGMAIRGFVEGAILERIPGYTVIRSLTSRFEGASDDTSTFAPALVTTAPGTRELAFIVDEPDTGDVTVFFPLSPMATVGTIRFVSRDRVQAVDASMGAAVNCLMHWGLGSQELFAVKSGGDSEKR